MASGGARKGAGRKQASPAGQRKAVKFYLAPDEEPAINTLISLYKDFRAEELSDGIKLQINPKTNVIHLINSEDKIITTVDETQLLSQK